MLATRPAPRKSISAFVEAQGNAHSDERAEMEQIRVFEFEDESLEDPPESDDDLLPPLQELWRFPVGLIANEVHHLVASLDALALSPTELAATLASAGHGVLLRRGLGAHDLAKAARTLRNEFVVLYRYGDVLLDEELIIEPHFRAHFELLSGDCSPAYQCMLAALPDIFVGRLQQLVGLVQLAAPYLEHEYRRHGRAVPPWRTGSALLSRWAPEHSQDVAPEALSPAASDKGTCDRSSACDRSSSFTSCDMSPVGSPASVLLYCREGGGGAAPHAVQTVYGFAAPTVTEEAAAPNASSKVARGQAFEEPVPRILSARLAPNRFFQ